MYTSRKPSNFQQQLLRLEKIDFVQLLEVIKTVNGIPRTTLRCYIDKINNWLLREKKSSLLSHIATSLMPSTTCSSSMLRLPNHTTSLHDAWKSVGPLKLATPAKYLNQTK
ncbi:unnamed protein product [Ceratitis capitata]|uniref:(Mediterranean fruit fly) hypothetical protein n=1 Tax=Ceratitis capitata TaxID=7213 RepID=A0A811V3E1_CERCA|nr:unnamed protein product [Ceratitis capitata]